MDVEYVIEMGFSWGMESENTANKPIISYILCKSVQKKVQQECRAYKLSVSRDASFNSETTDRNEVTFGIWSRHHELLENFDLRQI
jgi:hypothetical protein